MEGTAAVHFWSSWFFLLRFSIIRLIQVRQTVAIAFGLLMVCCLITFLITSRFGWDRTSARLQKNNPLVLQFVAGSIAGPAIDNSPLMESIRLESKPLAVFSRWMVFFIFLGFLLPLWSLCFAVSALGADRENRSLIWLLTRPLSRQSIYLAKFISLLPWCLLFNIGGFFLICLCGGLTGLKAFSLYFPAIIAGTVAFSAIFHLIAAIAPKPAIVGMLYGFFFETILSELPVPGTVKRLSVNYYVRCLMYSAAQGENVPTEASFLFVPVSDTIAWVILLGSTIAITLIGMWLFARHEYREES